MSVVNCPSCQVPVPANASICGNCGTTIVAAGPDLAGMTETAQAASAPANVRPTVSQEERIERLSRIVSAKTLEGWIVLDRNDRDPSAVLMVPGHPVNHVLHFLIGIFTCGFWWIVWVILALTQKKEQRVRLTIDGYGNMLEEKMAVS